MGSPQTLHDFVLNLLTNPDARSAFEIDPEGTLRDAGLADISVADVQDVVPLVVDYAPVQGLTALAPVGDDLGLGQFQLDPSGVIGQLQSVATQLGVSTHSPGSDVNAATLGAISVAPGALNGVLPGLGTDQLSDPLGLVDPLVPTGVDVADTLDAEVVDPVLTDSTGAVGTNDGPVGNTVDGGQIGLVDFAGDTVQGTLDDVTGLVDSLGVRGVSDTVGGVTDTVGGVTDTVTGVGDALDLGPLSSTGTPALDDTTSTVTGLTDSLGSTLSDTTSGVIGGSGHAGDVDASTSGGLLGIADDLL
ncbi:IniB N-terminal domain-containing protein [Plantactinospora sp. KLBMP9567]|uniref:IniB N-terminal domain-containing protein n=1 Tax=Plantactinospora sp. KLBMP9567 TaxID=3085900 RepID=UPI002980DD4E|nr:IniB N-terminal domain-containing protein [Plantactinospora sp. KLBMP9567]MDW5329860.1 IniB N-terminal domain-containing protein [Plantactinospora sp. KLBMP9567]